MMTAPDLSKGPATPPQDAVGEAPASGPSQGPEPSGTSGGGIPRPMIIGILYLVNFAAGFTAIVGVILAYIWRGEDTSEEWERTHYTYLIHTFWVSLVVTVLALIGFFAVALTSGLAMSQNSGAAPPVLFFVGVFGFVAVLVLEVLWFIVRCIVSLAKAGGRKPVPRPRTWWF